jgi:hypothetical protein
LNIAAPAGYPRGMRVALQVALVAFLVGLLPAAGVAKGPKLIGEYRDWDAYEYAEGGKPVCYVASTPKDSEPRNVRHGDVYAEVTLRPAQDIADEVSVYVGYDYRTDSTVAVTIEGQTFALFTDGSTAWAEDADTDRAVVAAMMKGESMVVRGTSARGTKTTYTYSLLGFTAARAAIRKACKEQYLRLEME